MQIKNIKIFDSTAVADGAWIDISNLVAFSVQLSGLEATVFIEASNDPNVNYDGAAIGPPAAGPILQAVSATAANANLVNQGTIFVKTTIITPWGETTASPETSLAVPDGKVLLVPPPVLTATQKLTAIGYNVYASKVTATEVLQTMPQFASQRVVDTGGVHWATAGALALNTNFYMVNGFQQTDTPPPSGDNSGGVAAGINISGNFTGAAWTAPVGGSFGETQVLIDTTAKTALVNPSCLVWKWIRVRKITGATLETVAYLMGQNG